MRAVWYDRQGAADEVLVCGELPTPDAGHGEVRVRLFRALRFAVHRERHMKGFNSLSDPKRSPGPITEAACWSHGRCKFFVLADVAKAPLAVAAVRRLDAVNTPA
jgi:hypothetical protein